MTDRELLRECFARFEELSRELPDSSMWWTAGDRRFQKTMNKVKDALVKTALEPAPREANDDDARDAARWRAIEWRWGSGTVTLDCDDKGFFRMQVEHAEANDEYITALDPEGVLAKAITAEEASSREYVQQPLQQEKP